MQYSIKAGSQRELRQWLRKEKRKGNASQYIALDFPDGQRLVITWPGRGVKISTASAHSSRSS